MQEQRQYYLNSDMCFADLTGKHFEKNEYYAYGVGAYSVYHLYVCICKEKSLCLEYMKIDVNLKSPLLCCYWSVASEFSDSS